MDCSLLRECLSFFKPGKTCADDHIVAEMLQALDDDILEVVASAFKLRLLNHDSEDFDKAWDQQIVLLIRKKLKATFITDFRPIAVISVLQKLYSRVLLELAGVKVNEFFAPQFAFRVGHQAHEPIYIMRSIIEKYVEWNIPIFILDGDICKAYDYTRHSQIIKGLQKKGVPNVLTAGWLREVRRISSTFVLDSSARPGLIERTRSILQEDPPAPAIFNCALDDLAEKFCRMATFRNWGIKLQGGARLSLVLLAENYWIFARSPRELTEMLNFWLGLLRGAVWKTPSDEITWCTTGADETKWKVYGEGAEISRTSRKVGFRALGVHLTFDNQFDVELKARIDAAWRAFYKYADLLFCRSAPIAKRLQVFNMVARPALFWCAGSWNLTKVQLSKLRGVQRRMIRKMLGSRRQTEENLEEYMRRTNKTITHLMRKHRVEAWDAQYHRLYFSWGGEVASMRFTQPQKLTYQVLKHRDIEWIHKMSAQYGGRQQHGRKLHTWRWERYLSKYSPDWQEKALDKSAWQKSLDDMITWRCTRR